MRELLSDLLTWQQAGKKSALATVIKTWGSSPRPMGSHMAVSEDGHFIGSVSGGCVESAVIAESIAIIETGQAKRLTYGVSDETAWEVGLACGGQIEVFVQKIDRQSLSPLLEDIQANKTTWYSITLDQAGKLSQIQPPTPSSRPPILEQTGDVEIFTNAVFPPNQLIIVGGVNIAQPLVPLAKQMDYTTILVDPRRSFATRERFTEIDQIINAWPQEAFVQIEITPSTAIAILSHDDKIDLPALQISLASPAFYIGALGSTTTQKRRKQLLIEKSVDPQSLERIKGPIGLDLGGNSPAEIALAIIAQIISESHKIATG
jgi:xanthine dehydrogenase accessory factor